MAFPSREGPEIADCTSVGYKKAGHAKFSIPDSNAAVKLARFNEQLEAYQRIAELPNVILTAFKFKPLPVDMPKPED